MPKREREQGKGKPRAAAWLISAAFLVVLAFWGYATVRDTVPQGLPSGTPAPLFEATDIDGDPFSLADLRGTPVVLRFSSRTCAFCYDDFDVLEAFQREYGGRLQVVAVEVGASEAMVRSAVRGRNGSYPVVVDVDGSIAEGYRLGTVPQLYFIDAQGRLQSRAAGELADLDVASHVAAILESRVMSPEEVEAEVRAIAQAIRCQECRGLSVWESNVASAWEMKQEIWERVEAGERRDEILDDLVDRYGVWILMAPPARGGFLWVYLVPFLFLGVVGLLLRRVLQGGREGRQAGGVAPDAPLDPAVEARIQQRLKDYL